MGHKHNRRARRAMHSKRQAWPVEFSEEFEARRKFGPPAGFGPGGPGGPGEGFGPPPGFGPPWMRGRGPGRGPGRGGRNRGDIRTAILVLLAEQPRHGYELIRAIEERSGGTWVPSAGSIYPTLQALEDEGLITIELVDGRKTASLTAAGSEWVEARPQEADAVFIRSQASDEAAALWNEFRQLAEASQLIAKRPDLAGPASAVLAKARKEIYQLLADA